MSIKKIPAVEIRICDRCKADETEKNGPFAFSSMQMRISHTQGDQGGSYVIDLCHNCTKAFDAWMKVKNA